MKPILFTNEPFAVTHIIYLNTIPYSWSPMENLQALLVQRRAYNEPDLLSEFERIATTAGYSIHSSFDIVSPPSARFGISTGKVEEIANIIEVSEIDIVLFTPTLRSSQIFRLMERWQVEVRDRNQVILEIFDRHAKTQQAKLQIEQARLQYELPFEKHQIRMRLQKEHTGDRPTTDQVGAGEDLLTKRMSEIRYRIGLIESKLKKISESQSLKKKKRSSEGFLEVALAGYTNAGKSTLHHALTGSQVEIADKLFTTLSTKTAILPTEARQVVISDSVGFISDLPAHLLRAFNTTLMEITEADVIVLVVDASDSLEEIDRKVKACMDTFSEIGANGIPIVVAMNKIDLITEEEANRRIKWFQDVGNSIVAISAKENLGLDILVDVIEDELPALGRFQIHLPYGDEGMSILSWLHDVGSIKNEAYQKKYIEIEAELGMNDAEKLTRMNIDVEVVRLQ
ncbi:MAG: GTPase HflX [Candidatus Thorarchaeota archaeon]